MTSTTLERIHSDPNDCIAHELQGLIEHEEKMPQDRRLQSLAILAEKHIPFSKGISELDTFYTEVPAAMILCDELVMTAQVVIDQTETFDEASTFVVHNIGIAADAAQNDELLKKTVDMLEDARDLSLIQMKKAMEQSLRNTDLTYSTAYKALKKGSVALSGQPTLPREIASLPSPRQVNSRPVDMNNLFSDESFEPLPIGYAADMSYANEDVTELNKRL